MSSPPSNPIIRQAWPHCLHQLAAIEQSAAQIFRTANMHHIADGPTIPLSKLTSYLEAKHLWTIHLPSAPFEPVGLLAGYPLDKYFHIAEISVQQDCQGKNLGKLLLAGVEMIVKEEGFDVATLTTYRDLKWNGLWYGKMGYEEVEASELGEGHVRVLEEEKGYGHDMSRRCVMMKRLDSTTASPFVAGSVARANELLGLEISGATFY